MKKIIQEIKNIEVLDDHEIEYTIKYLQNKLDKRKEVDKDVESIEMIQIDEGCEGAYLRLDKWDKVDPIDLKNFITDCFRQQGNEASIEFRRYTMTQEEFNDSHVNDYDWFTFNDEIDYEKYKKISNKS